jgi:hypothetical protein
VAENWPELAVSRAVFATPIPKTNITGFWSAGLKLTNIYTIRNTLPSHPPPAGGGVGIGGRKGVAPKPRNSCVLRVFLLFRKTPQTTQFRGLERFPGIGVWEAIPDTYPRNQSGKPSQTASQTGSWDQSGKQSGMASQTGPRNQSGKQSQTASQTGSWDQSGKQSQTASQTGSLEPVWTPHQTTS